MVNENAPNWQPAGERDFVAAYILNFYNDLNHTLLIDGSWQGDFKSANTLFVDNFQNSFELVFQCGAYTETIPANAQGYINVERKGFVQIIAPVYCFLPVKLLTERKQPGYTARGNAPVSFIDPFYPSVVNLFHFDTDVPLSASSAVTTVESKTNVPFTLPAISFGFPFQAGAIIGPVGQNFTPIFDVYAQFASFEFGSRVLLSTMANQNTANVNFFKGGNTGATTTNLSTDIGVCLFHNYLDNIPGVPATPQYIGNYALCGYGNAGLSVISGILGVNYDASGNTTIFIGRIAGNGTLNKQLNIPFTFKNFHQYIISYYYSGNYVVVYVDGVAIGAGSVTGVSATSDFYAGGFPSLSNNIFSHPLAFFDEIRITTATRNISRNFSRQNAPWPNG